MGVEVERRDVGGRRGTREGRRGRDEKDTIHSHVGAIYSVPHRIFHLATLVFNKIREKEREKEGDKYRRKNAKKKETKRKGKGSYHVSPSVKMADEEEAKDASITTPTPGICASI